MSLKEKYKEKKAKAEEKKNQAEENKSEEKKRDSEKSKKSRALMIVAVLSVAALIAVGAFFFFDIPDLVVDIYNGEEKNKVDSSVVGSEGFPVSFMSNDIIASEAFSSKIFVLTGKLLTCVKSNGEVDFTQSFTYVNPGINVSDKYGVVFDRGSSKFMIFNAKGVIYQGTTEDNRHIISAFVDNKGNCALATKSDDSACRVYLVNKYGKILYIWSCVEEYAVSLDISSDGKMILCGTIGAYNGEILTKVYKLDVTSEQVSSYTISGSGCVDVSLYGRDKAIVTCLDKRVILDLRTEDGAPLEATYPSQALYISCDSNGYCAVITDKLSSFDKDEITVYNHNNTVIYKAEIGEGSNDIECIGKKVCLLTDDSVDYLDSKGNVSKSVSCGTRGEGIVVLNGKAYFYTAGALNIGF